MLVLFWQPLIGNKPKLTDTDNPDLFHSDQLGYNFILDRIHRIDWIHCFLCFPRKPKNCNPAFSGKKKLKKPNVLFPNDYVVSSLCFHYQKNSLEEGFKFLPFFRKGKRSWESCRSCLKKITGFDDQCNNHITSNPYKMWTRLFTHRFSGGT